MTFDAATNIRDTGNNPPFTRDTFLSYFPQFTNAVSETMVNRFIAQANATLSVDRWYTDREYAMALFVAHRCTLYLQTSATEEATVDEALAAGQAAGNVTAVTQGDVKVVMDHGAQTEGTKDWGMWNATAYGRELATMAKVYGIGGSYVI